MHPKPWKSPLFTSKCLKLGSKASLTKEGIFFFIGIPIQNIAANKNVPTQFIPTVLFCFCCLFTRLLAYFSTHSVTVVGLDLLIFLLPLLKG